MGPNPKNCATCGNDYDGRRKDCPYCADDKMYKEAREKRKSSRSSPPPEGVTGGTTGASASVSGDLDRSIDQLGDVSSILAEFKTLSLSLNGRMDKIENLIVDINRRLPMAGASGSGVVQDGGGAGQEGGGL